MNLKEQHQFMVHVSCMTFNHVNYIIDAMNGFCIQETKFPFVCTIIDDISTDGEQEVIKKYLEEHFDLNDESIVRNEETDDYVLTFVRHKTNKNCYFAVLYLKYNHYSIKKPKMPYIAEWYDNAKYIALCEGDDYWTHPQKLQRQIDFLESNPDFTMACHRIKCYSQSKQKMISEEYCYHKSRKMKTKDIIYRTGLFISTCSIVYRKCVKDNYPDYCSKCRVGDYPLQIMCAMKGNTYYFDEVMGVYRVDNSNSWMGRQKWGEYSEERVNVIRSQIRMFRGFAKDYPKWTKIFHNKIVDQIIRFIPCQKGASKDDRDKYLSAFSEEINNFSTIETLEMKMRMNNNIFVRKILYKIISKRFSRKVMLYKES